MKNKSPSLKTADKEAAAYVYELMSVLANPETRALSARVDEDDDVLAMVGYPPEIVMAEAQIFGETKTVAKTVQEGQAIEVDARMLGFLAKRGAGMAEQLLCEIDDLLQKAARSGGGNVN